MADPLTLAKKSSAAASPLASLWVHAMACDPLDKDETLTLEMRSMVESHSSGISDNIATPSEVASVLFGTDDLSFEGRTADANILSLESSSEDEEDSESLQSVGLAESFEDQAFAKNSTPLYEALRRREWRQAMVFLQNGSFMSRNLTDGSLLSEPRIVPPEEQVRTWVSMYEVDGRLVWRRLPIHDALCRGAPADLMFTMLQLHPLSVEAHDWDGNLPLHLAMMHNAERSVVEMILQEYPQAIEVRNDKGKLPLECVTMKGRPSSMRGEVLQRYVSSAKQVATQEVPKLKDELFEVNKTIEAAKSELRLAKVELGMIKQQEKMRVQNKEMEENKMKEEVLRLRSELELLKSERDDFSEAKEQWVEKSKAQQHQVLAASDSDSDDSQRSWLAMEFTAMVSQLEQTTLTSKETRSKRKPKDTSTFKRYYPTASSTFQSKGGNGSLQRSAQGRSGVTGSDKDITSVKTGAYDLRQVQTAATEASLDCDDELSQERSSKNSSKDFDSIRSIRQEFDLRRKKSTSQSSCENGDDRSDQGKLSGTVCGGGDSQRGRSRGSQTGSRDRGEDLAERIKKLETCSNTVDEEELPDSSIVQNSSTTKNSEERSCSRKNSRESSQNLQALAEKISDVLGSNCSDTKASVGSPQEFLRASSKGAVSSSRSGEYHKGAYCQPDGVTRANSKGSIASSKSGKTSSRSSSTRESELRGLAMLAESSSEVRWHCNSMADDLTDEEEQRSNSPLVNSSPASKNAVVAVESRDEATNQFISDRENREETDSAGRSSVRHNVTFAEETVIYEGEARDSFSPQFRRFDAQIDEAMTRISRKTHKLASSSRRRSRRSRSRSRGHGHSRSPVKGKYSGQEIGHIYVTTNDKVEILGSDQNSVKSYNSGFMSEPSRGRMIMSEWEDGYSSDV